jgi:hypothetical protein
VTNRIVITERSNAGALRILDSLGNHDLEFSPSIEIFDGYEGTSRFQQAMSSGPTDFYYPALAVPVDHKTNESFICPQDHIDLAKTFIRNSADFLFLGFSALDTHVVDLFRDAQRVHRLLVVDRADDEASHIIERISRVNPIFAPPAHVGLANPPNYNGTFQQFIKSNYLRTVFLQSSQTVGVYNPAHI